MASPVVSRCRLALVLIAGAYPLITTLLYAWSPLLAARPPWQVTLVVVPQMVAGMVWGIIPLAYRLFGSFILRPAR